MSYKFFNNSYNNYSNDKHLGRFIFNQVVCLLLLVCIVACNMNFSPSFKERISDEEMKPAVAKVIDAQMDCIKDSLDEDLRESIDNGGKGTSPMTGAQIVELTMQETGGRDYLDFCYAVDISQASLDTDPVMSTAQSVLSEEEYDRLNSQVNELEKNLTEKGNFYAKGLPLDQQEAFFKDLKVLVTRAIVLLVAGIVYACVPKLVFWGKISAAAAISVGAGLVALSIMSLYEYYQYGLEEDMTFEEWFKELIKIPQADFALTTTVTSMAEAMGMGPVVTGIIICVYAIYNVTGLVRNMMETYNLDAKALPSLKTPTEPRRLIETVRIKEARWA